MTLGIAGQQIEDDVFAGQFRRVNPGIENGNHGDRRFRVANGVDQVGEQRRCRVEQPLEHEVVFGIEQIRSGDHRIPLAGLFLCFTSYIFHQRHQSRRSVVAIALQ